MATFEYLNSLYKDLITEDTNLNGMKYISFTPEEIVKFKKEDTINFIKPIDELSNYNVGDYIKTEWGRVYKVEDTQIYANLEDWPYLNTLSLTEIEELSSRECSYKAIILKRVLKKETKRYFYDCEFDETKDSIELISIAFVDEERHELYLINEDYNWQNASEWLKLHVYPFIKEAPDYIKIDLQTIKNKILAFIKPSPSKNIKLYGYYSAYDHVCLCKLFGTMNNLPEYMPMYTIDLKQTLDYFNETLTSLNIKESENEHNALSDAKFNYSLYKAIKDKFNPKYL